MSRLTVTAGVLAGVIIGGASVAGVVWQRGRDDTPERCREAVTVADRLVVELETRQPNKRPPTEAEQETIRRRFVSVVLSEPSCFPVEVVARAREAERTPEGG